MHQAIDSLKTLPWGDEIYLEIPLHHKSSNKFYARHGKTIDGREYIEFTKFGPMPNSDNEYYHQKLRLFNPLNWAQIKFYVETELAQSIGWDLAAAEKDFKAYLKQKDQVKQ